MHVSKSYIAIGMLLFVSAGAAQTISYNEPYLTSIFPSGGARDQTVSVLFRGLGIRKGENRVVIDGPPGVTVEKTDEADNTSLRATLKIAADAPLGPRMVRVHNLQHGLTNFRYFYVGELPHCLEQEPNNTTESAQQIATPCIVDARIQKTLDIDAGHNRLSRGGLKPITIIVSPVLRVTDCDFRTLTNVAEII